MFEFRFKYRFESAHRFTKSSSNKCMTPHGHTWWATLVLKSSSNWLGDDQMVAEFSKLKSNWKTFITEVVDHSFFHHYQDPILPSLKEHIPDFRGLPFPGDPTTECVASLFYEKAKAMLLTQPEFQGKNPLEIDSVEIQETPTNGLSYSPKGEKSPNWEVQVTQGWWTSPDPMKRSIEI